MLYSCKITNAVLLYLDRKGADLSSLEQNLSERFDLPPLEFLKDPSCWLRAKQMEDLLDYVSKHYGNLEEQSLLAVIGHESKELRAWGVLDSVLRMLQSPQDVFLQPQRFLSYFISPPPPVANIKRDENSISLDLPIAADEFPRVVEYLKAAIESIPTYLGQSLAQVVWSETKLHIDWCNRQADLLAETPSEKALHPELVQSILRDLEHSQKQIEQLQLSIRSKSEEIEQLKKQSVHQAKPLENLEASNQFLDSVESTSIKSTNMNTAGFANLSDSNIHQKISESIQQVYKLADYMARCQQLVTMLVGQNRLTPQVQEAMKRVDWERIQSSTTVGFTDLVAQLRSLDLSIKKSQSKSGRTHSRESSRQDQIAEQIQWSI